MPSVCGKCQVEFETDELYLDHTCVETGYTPKDVEHQGEAFKAISEAALKRGAKRAAESIQEGEIVS